MEVTKTVLPCLSVLRVIFKQVSPKASWGSLKSQCLTQVHAFQTSLPVRNGHLRATDLQQCHEHGSQVEIRIQIVISWIASNIVTGFFPYNLFIYFLIKLICLLEVGKTRLSAYVGKKDNAQTPIPTCGLLHLNSNSYYWRSEPYSLRHFLGPKVWFILKISKVYCIFKKNSISIMSRVLCK